MLWRACAREQEMKAPSSTDPRVVRTRAALRQALISLILERGWDAVGIHDICQRAQIGRSTFYTHFADKEELLLVGFDELRRWLRGSRAAGSPATRGGAGKGTGRTRARARTRPPRPAANTTPRPRRPARRRPARTANTTTAAPPPAPPAPAAPPSTPATRTPSRPAPPPSTPLTTEFGAP